MIRSRAGTMLQNEDARYLERAIELALLAEKEGNLPVGAVIRLDAQILGEGGNRIVSPHYDPARHAEIEALRSVPVEAWARASEITCYSTLEPCVMCTGTLLLHGVGRVVFGARDVGGGGGAILSHLPPFFAGGAGVPEWTGPALPERCDPLFERARAMFRKLPCGRRPVRGSPSS